MARKHQLWSLLAPLAIAIFVAIPQLVGEVGALSRFLGYLALLAGGMGILTTQVALSDNRAPRWLRALYLLVIAVWIIAFIAWLFAPLDQSITGVRIAAYSAFVFGSCYIVAGLLGPLGYALTGKTKRR